MMYGPVITKFALFSIKLSLLIMKEKQKRF